MKKMAAGTATVERLIGEGWKVSHTATVNRYHFAGSTDQMKPRNGREYIRVYHGKCVGIHNYQLTTVMYRPLSI